MKTIPETFGSMVFNDRVMKAVLPAKTYASLKHTIDEGAALDPGVADAVAQAMKEWALSKGATHFTHWFQPLTGITAEKHESFIAPSPDGGKIFLALCEAVPYTVSHLCEYSLERSRNGKCPACYWSMTSPAS